MDMSGYMRRQNRSQIKVKKWVAVTPRHSMISPPKEKQWQPASAVTLAELAHTGKITLKHVQAATKGGIKLQRFQREFWRLFSRDSIGDREVDLVKQFKPVLI